MIGTTGTTDWGDIESAITFATAQLRRGITVRIRKIEVLNVTVFRVLSTTD